MLRVYRQWIIDMPASKEILKKSKSLSLLKFNSGSEKSSLELMVSRPLPCKFLTKVQGWLGIHIWKLSESSLDWVDFGDDVIFRNSRLSFPESKLALMGSNLCKGYNHGFYIKRDIWMLIFLYLTYWTYYCYYHSDLQIWVDSLWIASIAYWSWWMP